MAAAVSLSAGVAPFPIDRPAGAGPKAPGGAAPVFALLAEGFAGAAALPRTGGLTPASLQAPIVMPSALPPEPGAQPAAASAALIPSGPQALSGPEAEPMPSAETTPAAATPQADVESGPPNDAPDIALTIDSLSAAMNGIPPVASTPSGAAAPPEGPAGIKHLPTSPPEARIATETGLGEIAATRPSSRALRPVKLREEIDRAGTAVADGSLPLRADVPPNAPPLSPDAPQLPVPQPPQTDTIPALAPGPATSPRGIVRGAAAPATGAQPAQDAREQASAPTTIAGATFVPSGSDVAPQDTPATTSGLVLTAVPDRLQHPAPTAHASELPARPAPIVSAHPSAIGRGVGIEVARAAADGESMLTIRLDPVSMGRIEVRITFDDKGALRALVTADNPASLDALRRDSGQLSQALSDAGIQADQQSFQFSNSGGGGDPAGSGAQRRYQPPGAVPPDQPSPDQPEETLQRRVLSDSGNLDLIA